MQKNCFSSVLLLRSTADAVGVQPASFSVPLVGKSFQVRVRLWCAKHLPEQQFMRINVARPLKRINHLSYKVSGVIVEKTVCWQFNLDKYCATGETFEKRGVAGKNYWQDGLSRRQFATAIPGGYQPCRKMAFFARMTARINTLEDTKRIMDNIEELEQIPDDIPLELEEVIEFDEKPLNQNITATVQRSDVAVEKIDEDLEELQEELDELLEPGEQDYRYPGKLI